MNRLVALGLSLLVAFLTLGCALPSGKDSLKLGLLPIVESLPLWVAVQEGYFEDLKVEPVLFASAVERDAALQTGQIDGELTDLISSSLLNKDAERIKVVRTAFKASPKLAMISLVAAPGSNIRTVADLRGKEVALSHNSVIEYVVDELLAGQGLKPGDAQKTEVSKIPVRLEMLLKGQVAAAGLPEPFATLARQQGAQLLADDGQEGIGQSVWVLRVEVLRDRPETVRRFLAAYERAVRAVGAQPEKYRALLAEKGNLPDAVRDTFAIPPLPAASVPSPAEVERATRWMVGKDMLSRPLAYQQLVDPGYLPAR